MKYHLITGLDGLGIEIEPYVINDKDDDLYYHTSYHGDEYRHAEEITKEQFEKSFPIEFNLINQQFKKDQFESFMKEVNRTQEKSIDETLKSVIRSRITDSNTQIIIVCANPAPKKHLMDLLLETVKDYKVEVVNNVSESKTFKLQDLTKEAISIIDYDVVEKHYTPSFLEGVANLHKKPNRRNY